jgi:hypothetical protein
MASGSRTCPECGAPVSARDAGCPSCGRILDRAEPGLAAPVPAPRESQRESHHEGEVERAQRGGTGWKSCALAGCGCLALTALAGFAFAILAGRSLSEIAEGFQRVQLEADLIVLRRALEEFADDHGDLYPERLDQLTEARDGGPWIEHVPLDRWSRSYVFEPPPQRARASGPGRLLSLGRDGAAGGEGDDADLDEAAVGIKPSPR